MRGYHIGPTAADQIVLQVGQINFVGNIIPHIWYQTIKHKNGKPYFLAIVLLSDIVYWYRPIEIRNEQSGRFIGWRKKFKADKLQRSYKSFADAFNVSRKQIKVAMDYLEEIGVIERDFRTIVMKDGRAANNILYIGLDSRVLFDITYPPTLEGRSLLPWREGGSYPGGGESPTLEGGTNTEITTENTTETYPAPNGADRVSGNKNKKPAQNPLMQAITDVFKTAPGQTRVIYRQMTGQTSKKNKNHISDFDSPATPDEVHAFAKWWAREHPKINLPTSPAKLQTHFYAFRDGGKKKRRRRVSDGRWLEYDEDLQRWMDQGPAKVEDGRLFIRENGKWCDIGPAPQKQKEASR